MASTAQGQPPAPDLLAEAVAVDLVPPPMVVVVPSPSPAATGVRLVCVSDTHDFHQSMPAALPAADILVHAGDFTCRGASSEVASFVEWVRALMVAGTVRHVVCVAGNHELGLEPGRAKHPVVVRAHEAMRQSLRDVPNLHFLEVGAWVRGCALARHAFQRVCAPLQRSMTGCGVHSLMYEALL
jgi:hypothetical protein